MASLKKRKKGYYIKFSKTIGGKTQEIVRSLETKNKAVARDRMKLLEERATYDDPFSPSFDWNVVPSKDWWTVQECVDDFLATKKRFRHATWKGYKYVLEKWVRHYQASEKLISSLKLYHFEDFLLRESIKAITRHSEKRRLKAFWLWCMEHGRVTVDWVKPVELPQKDVEYRPKMITQDEFNSLIAVFKKTQKSNSTKKHYRDWQNQRWFIPAMTLFFESGLRLSEVGVNKHDEKSGLRGSAILGVPGKKIDFIYISKAKKNRERFVPVNSNLEKTLLQYFAMRGWPKDDEYVFLNGKGIPVTGRTMSYQFKEYCKLAVIPSSRTIHGMRHNRGTTWLEMGFTLQEVKDMLGHYSVDVTDQFYTHLTPNKLKEKMNKLDN